MLLEELKLTIFIAAAGALIGYMVYEYQKAKYETIIRKLKEEKELSENQKDIVNQIDYVKGGKNGK